MSEYIKYPRTYHLPWSNATSDDKMLQSDLHFEGRQVVVTEKLDGENTTLYNDIFHARSIDSKSHESRNFVKAFHAQYRRQIPTDMRICCENVTAKHSIHYSILLFFLYGISVCRNYLCLSWDECCHWFDILHIPSVPVIYRGQYKDSRIRELYRQYESDKLNDGQQVEGYVVRMADSFKYDRFKYNVAKYVRPNHVQTDEHWMHKKMELNIFGRYYG